MRYTGPKNRLARREGIDLNLKTPGSKAQSNLLKRIKIVPGQHGASRRRKVTDYGVQLREKQKVRRIYGVTEKQMKNYFKKALLMTGNTTDGLIHQLEHRLDNVIYRLGFAPTRQGARQLVTHGNVLINKKKLNIPSYQVKIGEEVNVSEKGEKIPYITAMFEKKDTIIPEWLKRTDKTGKITNSAQSQDFKDDVNLQLVIEFYSR